MGEFGSRPNVMYDGRSHIVLVLVSLFWKREELRECRNIVVTDRNCIQFYSFGDFMHFHNLQLPDYMVLTWKDHS